MRGLAIGAVVIFAAGGLLGNKMASPEVDIVKIPGKTRVVEKEAPAQEPTVEYVLPPACFEAMDAARSLWEYGSKLYNAGDRQQDIISDVRLYLGQGRDLDELSTQQRRLSGEQVGDLQEMSKAINKFRKYEKECEEHQ